MTNLFNKASSLFVLRFAAFAYYLIVSFLDNVCLHVVKRINFFVNLYNDIMTVELLLFIF